MVSWNYLHATTGPLNTYLPVVADFFRVRYDVPGTPRRPGQTLRRSLRSARPE